MKKEIEGKLDHEIFKGFHRLNLLDSSDGSLDMNNYASKALRNLLYSFEKKSNPSSSLESSLFSMKMIEELL